VSPNDAGVHTGTRLRQPGSELKAKSYQLPARSGPGCPASRTRANLAARSAHHEYPMKSAWNAHESRVSLSFVRRPYPITSASPSTVWHTWYQAEAEPLPSLRNGRRMISIKARSFPTSITSSSRWMATQFTVRWFGSTETLRPQIYGRLGTT